MLIQLESIEAVLNSFQDDKANLSDCVLGWLKLLNNPNISENIHEAINERFRKTATIWHSLAYMFDNRKKDDRPDLPSDLQNDAREFVLSKDLMFAMASYEMEECDIFPKITFSKDLKKLTPNKYWSYVSNISINDDAKKFSNMMARIFSLPPSSAGIERLFSAAGLVQSKLRNPLSSEKVGRLVKVSRLLLIKEGGGQGHYKSSHIGDLEEIPVEDFEDEAGALEDSKEEDLLEEGSHVCHGIM